MLDLKFIRENPDLVREGARKKRIPFDLDRLLALDKEKREIQTRTEVLAAEQRRSGKEVASAAPEARAALIARQAELKREKTALEERLKEMEADLHALLLRVPMPPAAEVPEGKDDTENQTRSTWGTPSHFDFAPKDHVALGEQLGIVDFERGSRIAGSRNYFLKGLGALLESAVLRLAVDHMVKKGFTLMAPPVLVRDEAMIGTGYYPGGEEQAYRCERDALSLVGTSEVPLTSYHAGEILDPAQLPLRYVACTPCFRREAGAAGQATRGLYRVHQFTKVEQVVIGPADEAWSREEHFRILQNSEELVRMLELPYRVVDVCGGDLGQGQVQKFDIECWMPGRGGYGETHSASRFHDFQARRLELRYRPGDGGKPVICHTLNNTVIASPRILIPLLEVHQQADGSVRIPQALRPYLGGLERIGGS
ncbi:MAG: serine--tRNA ligase [Planctomycetes bacterium]|nr:serine--tRNA ligase [Planctomycetota bacterium]